MTFREYCAQREWTGTVGGAAAGQWADMPIDGEEFYRKMGNKVRPKTVAWDGFGTPPVKAKVDPRTKYGMGRRQRPVSR